MNCQNYFEFRSVSGSCNNLLYPEYGAFNRTMDGVLFSSNDRKYECYNDNDNDWHCGYNITGEFYELPKERDVIRFIHQLHANMIGKPDKTPVDSYYNSLVTAMGVFIGHEIAATEATASSTPADSPCTPFCGDFLTDIDQRLYLTDVHWDDSVVECDYTNRNCSDEMLFEPIGAPPFLLQGDRKTYLGNPNFNRLVPWLSKIRHNKQEVISGDGKLSPMNMVTPYLDLSNVYSANQTRHEMLLADDFAHTGKLKTSVISDLPGQTDERTGYCSFTEYVTPNNGTKHAETAYFSEKTCWEAGAPLQNFTEPWCYKNGSEWNIVDIATTASTCALCYPTPGSFPMNIGERCSVADRDAGKCLPSTRRRELCIQSAERNNLEPHEYVLSFTTGLSPSGMVENWLPTAADVGETFNADFFRNYGFPEHTSIAGDGRGHENLMLNYFQVLYLREHNRIAQIIKDKCNCGLKKFAWIKSCDYYRHPNGIWKGEMIYNHARIINSGRFQYHVDNYLKEVIGDRPKYKRKSGYDQTIDPKTPMEMAIASRKHSIVPETLYAVDNCGNKITKYVNSGVEGPNAHEWLNSYQWVAAQKEDFILYGLASESMAKSDEISILNVNFPIFVGSAGVSVPTLTLNRARDHNLGTYDEVHEAYFGEKFTDRCQDTTSLSCFKKLAFSDALADKLHAVYGDVKLVDLWTGFLTEKKYRRSIDGKLHTKVQTTFFDNIRKGDRFWYKNANQFTKAEMKEFKKYSLRDLFIIHANDPEAMDRVLGRNIYRKLNEYDFDDAGECGPHDTYMPPPGVADEPL